MSTLVVGEALVDVVQHLDASTARHPGGGPANVAVGLARLAHVVRLATRIGADADGALLLAHLQSAGVSLCEGSLVPAPTSTATAVLDAGGVARYVFELDWDLPVVDLAGVGHVHTGSVAATLEPGATAVRALLRRASAAAGVSTSYDPNLRPGIIGDPDDERAGVEALVARCDVVKASEEDLAWLYPDRSPDAAARAWADLGPALVVLTLGGRGARAWLATEPDRPADLPACPVRVVDTVGAGDAFMAGLLSGLLDAGLLGGIEQRAALRAAGAADVRPALHRATRAAALTCARPGADPPRRAEL